MNINKIVSYLTCENKSSKFELLKSNVNNNFEVFDMLAYIDLYATMMKKFLFPF